jgi:endonuclease/exonuclease/phosphatase family metal-dependent hydrolase
MRILTLNTWHNNGPWLQRREALIEGIVEYAADILLLQELFDADWSNELQARLGYPHLVSTECMHSGLVLLSKLPPRGNEIYRMKAKSPFETYWRYALWTELGCGGHRLSVFNTHLSWELQDDATRQAQVRELWSFIETHRSESGFAIVGGDFNCTSDSPAMSWFLAHSGFMDTYKTLHPGAAGFTWSDRNLFAQNHRPVLPNRRIDYLLAGTGFAKNRLRRCEVVFDLPRSLGVFASDHFGVLAELELSGGPHW